MTILLCATRWCRRWRRWWPRSPVPDRETPAVRLTAVETLISCWADHPATRALLCERVTADEDSVVRGVAVRALAEGWAEQSGMWELFRDCLTTDRGWHARRAAMEALARGWAGHPGTLALLQDKVALQLDVIEQRVRLYLDPPQSQLISLSEAADGPR